MQQPTGRRFEIGEALGAGWRLFWPNILPMALFALIVWAVNGLLQLLRDDAGWFVSFLLGLTGFIVGQLVAIGWIKLALDITDGRPVSAEAVLDRFRLVVPYLIAAVLFGLMVGIGLVLLIVPGVIAFIVFAFYGFHIVDTGEQNPFEALRRSAELTRGHRWQLFLFGLVLIGINILGLLVLLVGVLISSGISLLAVAYVYRRLAAPVAGPASEAATS
ncbi:MAG TPA: hypothetical protein VFZ37_07530 [Jiangellaceae bacterium]